MSVRKAAIRVVLVILGVFVVVALTHHALTCFGYWLEAKRNQGIVNSNMNNVYDGLCKYRERTGQWPKSLMEAMKEEGAAFGPGHILDRRDGPDPANGRPLLYYPDAKPGTKAILLAQPEPHKVGRWPFATMERLGVQADGKLVYLPDDESEVDDSK